MPTIRTLIKRLEAVDEQKVIVDSLRQTKEGITDAVILQLSMGIRSDGSEILPAYTETTIEIKKLKGQVTSFVNLHDTGDYYESIRTDVTGSEIITEATDWKADKLNKKYATRQGRLLKAGGKAKQAYIDDTLNPAFMRNIKKATGLK